ncbi:MAG: response regulator [Anaerolineae bacterium]|nr:response regulator [Anaerolineae bacterium]
MMNLKSKTVLIADDDPAFLRLVSFSVAQLGVCVFTATDGLAALDTFSVLDPDLVILDIMMPGLGGWEVCRLIRERSSTPVLMISARQEPADLAQSLDVGATAHLSKPLPIGELVQQVQGLLGVVDPGL